MIIIQHFTYMFVLFNTKDENMIQICICPGKPYDIVSYLQPLVDVVNKMFDRGLIIKKEGVEVYNGNVAILGFTGDIPGISELMVFGGHTSTYGCRVCIGKGLPAIPISSHGVYFPKLGRYRSPQSLIEGDEVGI